MLDSGNYSDLTICSGGQEYKVHKVVICLQSPFFAKACDGEFQEAKSNRIILAEDDHDTVKRMITYFYIHDYDDEVHSTAFSQPNESCFQGRHMPMREQPALFSSIRVYALADKYDIQELKSLAESRFRIWATTYWIHPDFPDMVRDVYNSTPSTDRGLRNIVEKVLVDHALEVTEQPRFKELLVEIVELGLVVIHFGLKRIASAKFAETRSRG
ncbi:MAG: hypothetical protein M1839_002284 [Geoglossum umbratile]|nr:MAG: hypothetical protein M1839_002284 [Geoglossum umbratile]